MSKFIWLVIFVGVATALWANVGVYAMYAFGAGFILGMFRQQSYHAFEKRD